MTGGKRRQTRQHHVMTRQTLESENSSQLEHAGLDVYDAIILIRLEKIMRSSMMIDNRDVTVLKVTYKRKTLSIFQTSK